MATGDVASNIPQMIEAEASAEPPTLFEPPADVGGYPEQKSQHHRWHPPRVSPRSASTLPRIREIATGPRHS